jgi:hypothetical protein
MKKLTALLLTFCFAAMIVGCTDETKTTKKEATPSGTTKSTTK